MDKFGHLFSSIIDERVDLVLVPWPLLPVLDPVVDDGAFGSAAAAGLHGLVPLIDQIVHGILPVGGGGGRGRWCRGHGARDQDWID